MTPCVGVGRCVQVQGRARGVPEPQVRDVLLGQQGDAGDQGQRAERHGQIPLRGVEPAGTNRVDRQSARLQ